MSVDLDVAVGVDLPVVLFVGVALTVEADVSMGVMWVWLCCWL